MEWNKGKGREGDKALSFGEQVVTILTALMASSVWSLGIGIVFLEPIFCRGI